ncbi:unnamed protein product [Musa textilis]
MEVSAAPAISPSSDERLWSRLRDRVDSILDNRGPKVDLPPSSSCRVESECGKRLREDSELLIKGFDSVSSSLSQLSSTLSSTQQRVTYLTKSSVAEELPRERQKTESEEPKAKRHCDSTELLTKYEANSSNKHEATAPKSSADNNKLANSNEGDNEIASYPMQNATMKKAKTLAVMMATKASYLSRELKTIKSELSFMQERCNLLEEENRRFQEDFDKGVRAEEDDLVRLQLEVLLAEKSRLANENANLMRENQCLHQLVEYHHLTSQDLSASYEQAALHGMCLDFSSPMPKSDIDDENGHSDCEVPLTPSTGKLGLFSSLDEHLEIHHDT